MNFSTIKNSLGATAVALSFAGLSAPASALVVAEFSVNHTPLSGVLGCNAGCPPGVGADFRANQITGNSSTLLTTADAGLTAVGTGWLNLTGFTRNNVAVLPGAHRVGVDYQLWAEFSYSLTQTGGTFGAANSSYNVTGVTVSLYGQNGTSATFTPADALANVAATVGNKAGAQLIGTATGIVGTAGINNLGGAFFNSFITYSNTAFGDTYFVDPVPFYDLAFNQFNNTTQGLVVDAANGRISINQATGSIDFVRVPEPATLAIVGLGLLGIAASRRRRV